MTVLEACAHTLKQIRTKKGMSQLELSFEADLDRTYISLLERGQNQPTLTSLFQLCAALEIEPEEFVRQVKENLQSNY